MEPSLEEYDAKAFFRRRQQKHVRLFVQTVQFRVGHSSEELDMLGEPEPVRELLVLRTQFTIAHDAITQGWITFAQQLDGLQCRRDSFQHVMTIHARHRQNDRPFVAARACHWRRGQRCVERQCVRQDMKARLFELKRCAHAFRGEMTHRHHVIDEVIDQPA